MTVKVVVLPEVTVLEAGEIEPLAPAEPVTVYETTLAGQLTPLYPGAQAEQPEAFVPVFEPLQAQAE
ncbi:MAG: hypothetical protein WA058_03845 [Minisyncoccia bacterium]